MTEGVYQILNFDIAQAVAANVLSPIIIPLALIYTIRGSVPKIDTKSKELIFFSSLINIPLARHLLPAKDTMLLQSDTGAIYLIFD
mgnify:CR=1 FL=1